MKQIIYIIALAALPLAGKTQSLFVSQTPIQKVVARSRAEEEKTSRKLEELRLNKARLLQIKQLKSRERQRLLQDSLITPALASNTDTLDELDDDVADVDSLINLVDTNGTNALAALNKTPHLTISGIGGISELQKPSQAGGNFSVQATFRLGDYKRMGASGWADPAFLYMSFNTRTGTSEDSDKLTKLFLFPNISKRDFVIGAYWQFRHLKNNWSIEPLVEFSLNRYKGTRDSINYGFNTESALLGLRLSKVQLFGDTTFEAGFVLFPYYSIINVQPKNYDGYSMLLKDALPNTVHTLGLQAVLQLSKVQFFADMKYILNRHSSELAVDDLKGFTYTIGTMVAVDVLRFRLTGH